jgi:hypothetical protein
MTKENFMKPPILIFYLDYIKHLNQKIQTYNGFQFFIIKLLVTQLIKKFPGYYETRKFITVLAKSRHESLSWVQ